ncbi:MAG: hypothetical protein U0R65_10895 [Candidatus Nanopelagicales bacterium]|jgi:hypothetical protein
MRKHILTGAGVCTVAVGLVLAASPAHAATNTYTYDCTGPITVYGTPGDTLVFNFGPGCQSYYNDAGEYHYFWNLNNTDYQAPGADSGFLDYVSMTNDGDSDSCDEFCGSTPQDWYVSTYDDSAVLTTTLRGTDGAGNTLRPGSTLSILQQYYADLYFAISYGGAHPADEGTPIPDVIQQVGAPAGGCTAVDDAALNWGGVKSGGWTSSWAEWADGGTGGSVCTRTLHYDNGWTVTAAS